MTLSRTGTVPLTGEISKISKQRPSSTSQTTSLFNLSLFNLSNVPLQPLFNLLFNPLQPEHLTEIGSMMGSGGMIVMDETDCMVDVALYFTRFLIEEFCGKCLPCREGLVQTNEILTRICKNQAKGEDIDTLLELGSFMLAII